MYQSYKRYFSDTRFATSFLVGVLFLFVAMLFQSFVTTYTSRVAVDSVSDIILSNIRAYDVDGIFVWGSVLAFLIIFFVTIRNIKYAPFLLKSTAFFTIIRSVFVSLTHISSFPTRIPIESALAKEAIFNGIFSGNDLFFSGHTGLPFLIALIFWDNEVMRYLYLGFSLMFAVVVLLGHIHYSIDVLSAFFITYTIYCLCKLFFKKDLERFLS